LQQQVTTLSSTVADSETIVRALKTPAHFDLKKGKLKAAAFRPPVGKSVISVMRQLIGDDLCKDHSVHICGVHYLGLAALTAVTIRQTDSQVFDAPEDFYGHAHIDHGFPSPDPHEPALAVENERATLRYRFLAAASKYQVDPTPASKGWSGDSLKI
jgi:hypothetical protein